MKFAPPQFIRANPDIALNKALSHEAWLAYCYIEARGGKSRKVLSPLVGLTDFLHKKDVAAAALAELAKLKTPYCRLSDGGLTLSLLPERWVRLPWWLVTARAEVWVKRVAAQILDDAYDAKRHSRPAKVNISGLLKACRLPGKTNAERRRQINKVVEWLVALGIITNTDSGKGRTTSVTFSAERSDELAAMAKSWFVGEYEPMVATWGGDPVSEAPSETTGHHRLPPQVEGIDHHRFEAPATIPAGTEPKERTPKDREHAESPASGDTTQSPAEVEPLIIKEVERHAPTTPERIESHSPCSSTDSADELAELWRDRRPAIVALYSRAAIDPTADTLVADIRAVMSQTFNDRLSLGALLGPRWPQLHKAIARWLELAESRVLAHVLWLTGDLGPDLTVHDDRAVAAAWDRVTGGAVPLPPISVIRRVAKID